MSQDTVCSFSSQKVHVLIAFSLPSIVFPNKSQHNVLDWAGNDGRGSAWRATEGDFSLFLVGARHICSFPSGLQAAPARIVAD